jgi:hypothetical protein
MSANAFGGDAGEACAWEKMRGGLEVPGGEQETGNRTDTIDPTDTTVRIDQAGERAARGAAGIAQCAMTTEGWRANGAARIARNAMTTAGLRARGAGSRQLARGRGWHLVGSTFKHEADRVLGRSAGKSTSRQSGSAVAAARAIG